MKKLIFKASLALSICMISLSAWAQAPATIAENPLPAAAGNVLRPQNAGSSTMQNVFYAPTASVENLYVHSWDVFGVPGYNAIAWRRTDAGGVLQNQGDIQIPDAMDIDVAIFESSGRHFVLAAYYNVASLGHYYDIYYFSPVGLLPVSTGNVLSASPGFGRINVDANTPYGLAITWCEPGVGIFVSTALLTGGIPVFTGPVMMPGTSNYKDPDICINRYSGFLALQIVYRNTAENEIREDWWDFFDANSGGTGTIANEDVVMTGNNYGVPRIDCAEQYVDQKWTYVYSEYSVGGGFVGERIWAGVLNAGWSPAPTTVLVHATSYPSFAYYENNPVVTYDNTASRIHIGWITLDNTAVIPGFTDTKYVADYVDDPGGMPPFLAGSYMMISNTPGGPAPVLAFSGQSVHSNFDGLHTAYSQYNTFFPGDYSMVYKDKPWPSPFFKKAETNTAMQGLGKSSTPLVFPSPFVNKLSLLIPRKGFYDISILSIEGKSLYSLHQNLDEMQQLDINTESFVPGVYFMKVISKEQNIDYTEKIVK